MKKQTKQTIITIIGIFITLLALMTVFVGK